MKPAKAGDLKGEDLMKKIGALLLAIVMVLAIGTSAFAAEDDTYKGSESPNAVISGGTNIPLTKSIVMFNTDGEAIREPNIKFTYAVTPVNNANLGEPLENVTVTDDGYRNNDVPVTVNVYNGVATAFPKKLELEFKDSADKVTAAKSGTELEKTGNLEINLDAFSHAGVYRFKITETANPSDVYSAGLDTRGTDYKNYRYLDVYIKNEENGSGLEMYGAVIFQSASGANDKITTETEKTTGFEPKTTDYENDGTVDKYHTFNLEVNKTITGGLADKTHDFPFEITLTGDKTKTIIADYSKEGATYVGTEPTTVDINTTANKLTPALSDGDKVTITGIPVGTKVMVKETNDTYDQYTPSIKTKTGFTDLALKSTGAMAARGGTAELSVATTEITDKTQKSVIGLENTLAEVSPTGVVLRVAPYAMILVAGLALMLISRRRNAMESDEE
jgi:hypothetical protein